MTNVEKLSIALPPEMAAMLREAVKRGDYASASEVVREALREWKQRRSLRPDAVEEIRRLWGAEIKSGSGRPGNIAAIKSAARRRSARKRNA